MNRDVSDQSRITLKRKMQPAVLFITLIFTPVVIFGVVEAIIAKEWFGALVISSIGLGLLANYLIDMGYRLSRDSTRIHMRDWGYRGFFRRHPEHSMTYGEISAMSGKFKGNAGIKSSFMPFEFLELTSSIPDTREIWIYPPGLRDSEVKSFLFDLYAKRPDIFPGYVLDYMRSGKRI